MNMQSKLATTGVYVIFIAGLAGLPGAVLAQQEAIAEYNRDLSDNTISVVDENRDLRQAIDRLDSRIRCLEAPGHKCVSQSIGPGESSQDLKPVPAREL